MAKRKNRRGSAMLEFALTGAPLVFIWISVVQMALGMWHYHTMQYAVKATGSYLVEHGGDCASPNTCSITIETLASVMKYNAIGIPATSLQMTFNTVSSSDHKTVTNTLSCTLTNATTPANGCDQNTTTWPPAGANSAGNEIEILSEFQWSPAIGMVGPGSGGVVSFASFWLPAYTHQVILF